MNLQLLDWVLDPQRNLRGRFMRWGCIGGRRLALCHIPRSLRQPNQPRRFYVPEANLVPLKNTLRIRFSKERP